MPKQFYPLFEGRTLFEETVLRNKPLVDRFWVASNAVQMELARDQLSRCSIDSFGCLIEPIGRNTAPAIALVCLSLPRDELVFVTPSDHLMTNQEAYSAAVARARILAGAGNLVTFGIRPTYAETGFGYIEANGELVLSFREKPDASTAQAYLESGHYLWNSGMFVFRAGVFLDELATHSPDVLSAAQAALVRGGNGVDLAPSLEDMKEIPSISIDYAVMEKSSKVRVVSCDPGWSDLGSFDALFDEVGAGPSGNAVLCDPSPIFVDSRNNLVVGSQRKVALVDVEDLIVIDTSDALLIVRRGSSQKVKDVVGELKKTTSSLLD
jgi:mannose-1-phosphate guanylyltransferase